MNLKRHRYFCSIIIPVRDRLCSLRKCLDSIALQRGITRCEVIVVDDGSHKHIQGVFKDYQFDLRVIRQVPLGIAAARNHGIQEAKGDLLLFTDSDCLFHKNCIFNLFQTVNCNPDSMVFQLKLVGHLNGHVGTMEHLRLTATQRIKAKGENIQCLYAGGFAIRRSFVNEANFFPLNVIRGEDTCALAKLTSKGISPHFVANAVVGHSPQYTLPKYIVRHFLVGFQSCASHVILRKSGKVAMGLHEKMLMVNEFHKIASKEKISRINIYFILLAYAFECCGRKAFRLFGIKPQRSKVLSIDIDPVREKELMSRVLAEIDRKNGFAITYLTAWSLVQSKRNQEHRMLLSKFNLIYADGMGVVLALFLTRLRRVTKVTFNDFYESFFEELSNRGYSIACVGGDQDVACKMAEYFANKHPSLKLALCSSGYLSKEEESRLESELLQSRPDIVLVAMGQPRQEKFVCSIRQHMPHTIFWCVGGLFDVIIGKAPTPPNFIRRIGLEWLYRLMHNPTSLWKRYLLGLPALAFYIVEEIAKDVFVSLKSFITKST